MALDITPEQRMFLAAQGLTLGSGTGKDIDQAWDDLHTSCQEGGPGSPSEFLLADPAAVVVAQDAALNLTQSLREAIAWGKGAEPGALAAWPVAPRSAFSRRKQVTLLDDPAVEPALADISLELCDCPVRELVESETVGEGEVLEALQLLRHTARYAPASERGTGPASSAWVLVEAGRLLPGEHRTAGEAKKAAVAHVKSLASHDLPRIDVVKLVKRETGPVWSVSRKRMSQKIRLRSTLATPKRDVLPCCGWIFVRRNTI